MSLVVLLIAEQHLFACFCHLYKNTPEYDYHGEKSKRIL
jgi:hypothetical protein